MVNMGGDTLVLGGGDGRDFVAEVLRCEYML